VIRKAILSFAETPIPEGISGHRPDGASSERPHLAIVPLPAVGHQHADGALLGVALILPRDVTESDQKVLFRAINRWETTQRTEYEETPRLPVHLGTSGTLMLTRMGELAEQRTLQPFTWCRPARYWVSATPIALDHNPGDLRSRDPGKLARAIREAEEGLRAGCNYIGLPSPDRVEVLPSPSLSGAAKARDFPPYLRGQGRLQRVLTHAAIVFAEPVAGPILLGAGRYVGLGLMRPMVSHD
jgi:CRISPR-associated protein Csb2